MKQTKLSDKDLILLLLYAKGFRGVLCEPIEGRTRITKMVFLFEKEVWESFRFGKLIPENVLPEFTAYHFGPFAPKVYTDIEFLQNLGFITVESSGAQEASAEEALELQWWRDEEGPDDNQFSTSAYTPEVFSLSERGTNFVETTLWPHLNDGQRDGLHRLKKMCTGVSLRRLLQYVYSKYPKMAEESQIRDEILSQRAYDY
ncbi:MAG: hypothetical protein M0Z66_13665 [Thermaerobacter sp.]|nr:hypothetical protein [Thermaerobacter sp.]